MPPIAESAGIKAFSEKIGIDDLRIVPATAAEENQTRFFNDYTAQGRHAGMHYLEKHAGKRADPRTLLPGAQSMVVILCRYAPLSGPANRHVALYAQGRDYHAVMKGKLHALSGLLPEGKFRLFCDTAPLLEKYWAAAAGLGHIGRNTLLIHPRFGSYCFIGILLCQTAFDHYDPLFPIAGRLPGNLSTGHPCHDCKRCMETCPGKALIENQGLDARRCFSYLTIESTRPRPPIPSLYWFGCDLCQSVCPANARLPFVENRDFQALEAVLQAKAGDFLSMEPASFMERFKESALLRAGIDGMRENAKAWLSTHPCEENPPKG